MQSLERPFLFDEGRGEPIQQGLIGGLHSLNAEVAGSSDNAASKVSLPKSVRDHAGGERIVIVDDVLSSGVTMGRTIELMRESGAEVALCMVLVNKTVRNEIDDVPLRGVIRAAVV